MSTVSRFLSRLPDAKPVVALDRRQALTRRAGVLGVGELDVHEAHVEAHPLLGVLLELLLLLRLGHELLRDLEAAHGWTAETPDRPTAPTRHEATLVP